MWNGMLQKLFAQTGFSALTWQHGLMLFLALVLIYLAVAKKFEPLLLLPIAFGMLLANLPLSGLMAEPKGQTPGGVLY
jgi:oxaloacetate decarboxylase beta subunit